jgi:TolB-like protein/tetratricopeptide (TPR) repeat protein
LKRESEIAPDDSIAHSTGRKLDKWIIAVLALAVVLLITNQFVLDRGAGGRAQSADTGPANVPAKSIAVLPFVNMSGDPKNDYFSDGITEEILNALAQVPKLKVAARTSAFAFKGKEEDLRKVGEVLDVATVLEGSVQRSGDEVRITAQLIDTRTGYHLWSEKYDRKLTSIFAVEDEISKAIADKLRVQLIGGGGQSLIRSATADPQAHALYLRAITDIARRGPALKDALLLLQQATARDPGYANAWAGLSQVYELLPWYQLGDWPDSLAAAERSAKRALVLDPQSGEAHAALANVLRDRLDYADADREYRKAVALSPGSSEIHNQFAQLLMAVGASADTLEHERIAVSLDPLAPNPRYNLGWELLAERRFPEAIAEFKAVLEHSPDYTYARFQIAFANLYAGRYDDARKLMRAATRQADLDATSADALIEARADPALRPQSLQLVEETDHVGRVQLGALAQAFWYGLLGAREPAIASLQRWVASVPPGKSNEGLRYLRLPAFDPIRDDPRFKAALQQLGLPYTPKEETAPAR